MAQTAVEFYTVVKKKKRKSDIFPKIYTTGNHIKLDSSLEDKCNMFSSYVGTKFKQVCVRVCIVVRVLASYKTRNEITRGED